MAGNAIRGGGVGGHGGEVGSVSGRAVQQAHRENWLVRRYLQAPLALAGAQTAGFELASGKRGRGTWYDSGDDVLVSLTPFVVDATNGDSSRLLARVDQPQLAHLALVAAGIEDGDVMRAVALRRQVVQASEEAIAGAHVREHLHIELGDQGQPPGTFGRSANAAGEALLGIAIVQVLGIEVARLACAKRQRDRPAPYAGVVERLDTDLASDIADVDHADEALPRVRLIGRAEQRHDMASFLTQAARCGQGSRQNKAQRREPTYHRTSQSRSRPTS